MMIISLLRSKRLSFIARGLATVVVSLSAGVISPLPSSPSSCSSTLMFKSCVEQGRQATALCPCEPRGVRTSVEPWRKDFLFQPGCTQSPCAALLLLLILLLLLQQSLLLRALAAKASLSRREACVCAEPCLHLRGICPCELWACICDRQGASRTVTTCICP